MTPERLRRLEELRDEAGRILDLLTEARARWALLNADEQVYWAGGFYSDGCDLGGDLEAAADHARAAVRRLAELRP